MDIKNASKIYEIANHIISIELQKFKETKEKPKMINNIAFTEYNESLKLDPVSPEAMLLTSYINNWIIETFHNDFIKDVVKYEEPTTDYVENPEEWKIKEMPNGLYQFECHSRTK